MIKEPIVVNWGDPSGWGKVPDEQLKTFPRVYRLLHQELEKAGSVNALVKKVKLTHNTIGNYLEGRAEPTQASLEKIGRAFGKSVAWLRGDDDPNAAQPLPDDVIDPAELSPQKRELWDLLQETEDARIEGVLALLRTLQSTHGKG